MTMKPIWTRLGALLWVMTTFAVTEVGAQVDDTPATRLRPIDAPSAVDRYRPRQPGMSQPIRETAYQNAAGAPVRQAVWQQPQPFTAPALPSGGGFQLPPGDAAPLAAPSLPPSSATMPPRGAPASGGIVSEQSILQGRTLPSGPVQFQPVPSSSDLTPLAPPQLGGEFATVGNCCCVSAPSTYRAASSGGCGPSVTYQAAPAYVVPPVEIPAPAVMPPALVTAVPPPSTPKPLFSFGQERKPVLLGQGIVGQPVAYVPGERFRNALRYIFP